MKMTSVDLCSPHAHNTHTCTQLYTVAHPYTPKRREVRDRERARGERESENPSHHELVVIGPNRDQKLPCFPKVLH